MPQSLLNCEWSFLSQMIYRINQCSTYEEFAEISLKQIKTMIPYTKGIMFQAENKQGMIRMVCPYAISPPGNSFDENRYIEGNYSAKWSDYMYTPWSNVLRHSDISQETDWTKTPIYQDILAPQNLHYGLYTTLIHNDRPLGAIVLWKSKESGDFTEKEMYIMDVMKIHFELKLYYLLTTQVTPKDSLPSAFAKPITSFSQNYGLTKREAEIAQLIYYGKTSEDICQGLYISDSTLRKHIHNVYRKVGVKTRVQLLKELEQFT